MNITKKIVKWHGQMELSYINSNQNRTLILGLKETLAPKEDKQGEIGRTCTCLKCIPKNWLVVVANMGVMTLFAYYNHVVWDLGFCKA